MTGIPVTFQPSGRKVHVPPGSTIVDAAHKAGIIVNTPCGGQGTCGKCKVTVNQKSVLACKTDVQKPIDVEIPETSNLESHQQILTHDHGASLTLAPYVRHKSFTLNPPDREDTLSDARRLSEVLQEEDLTIPVPVLRTLPRFLREQGWRGKAILAGQELIDLQSDDASSDCFGVAIDLGTTTLVATLFDLKTGDQRSLSSRLNGQIRYGDDVLSRIQKVRDSESGLMDLQNAIVDTLNDLLEALCQTAGIRPECIYDVVVAGNATMQQLLLGLDPSALGELPFIQTQDASVCTPLHEVGLKGHSHAHLYVFPQVGGFVGGDTVACILATRMDQHEAPTLLVDIGTNGEIVLAHEGKLLTASTAAGPAFEGARIRQGMRATHGAIEKVMIEDDVIIEVIGGRAPIGLCGTALIDAVAALLRYGILDETGRLLPIDEWPSSVPERCRTRLLQTTEDVGFVLASAEHSGTGEPICLWQKDIREFQLASGAIRAGITLMLQRAGLERHAIDQVFLAGAFGNYIRRENARRVGLLPDIPVERIHFIGNAASMGAKLALLSWDSRTCAETLAREARHIDFSLDPEFQFEFSMAMLFPGPEADQHDFAQSLL